MSIPSHASRQEEAPRRRARFGGLRFAFGVVFRAAPGLLALDGCITLAEALAPLALLEGTRRLLTALTAGQSPWPGLLLLALGEAIPAFGSRVLYGPIGTALSHRLEAELRPRVLAALATMPWARIEDPRAQDQLARVDDGIAAVDVAHDSASAFVRDVGRVLSTLGFLTIVSRWAALCAAAGLVPVVVLQRRTAAAWEGVRLAQLPARRRAGYLFGLLAGGGNPAEVRVFGYAAYVRKRWRAAFSGVQGAELRQQARTALREQIAGVFGTALILAAAALVLVRHGGAGTTASGLWALLTVFQQTSALGFWVASLSEQDASAANLARVLSWGRPLRPWPRPRRLRRGARGARTPALPQPAPTADGPLAALRAVTFTYPGGSTPAVRDLSLAVRVGECLALVGPNGSGKSTAVKLLLGLLLPDAGEAVVARRAAVAFQDFGRYALTAADNVGLGRPSQMSSRPRAASALAVVGLALAPAQPLGQRLRGGVTPSGGQWQRLALARALRSGAPLLVLDEPTAALDPLAESRLYADFRRLAAGRAVLLVTHRLAAARIADRIAVFADGSVMQSGSHADLLADGDGLYARMWTAQSGWAQ